MINNTISEKYQLIDDESIFRFQQLDGLAKQKVQSFGKQYHIISIIGSQSSGKSTLLNVIFKTEFEVLNRKKRVGQTTKGIWYSIDKPSKFMILDVQGSDSNQRQQRTKIQRRNSLFALSVSHTLLINLWLSQIGLYKGSQLAILDIILEINLKLFGAEKPKQIIFVVRDYMNNNENKQKLEKNLFQKVEQTWKKLPKPPGKQHIKLQDLFHLKAFFLPSKVQQSEQFYSQVEGLKKYLIEHSKQSQIIKENIPMTDFPVYMQNLWHTIESDKDINLPQQKILLSNMKCNQIQRKIYSEYEEQFRDELQRSERKLNQQFKKNIQIIVKKMMISYDQQTSCYIKQQAEKIKQQFIEFIQRKIQLSFSFQVKMISQECLKQFSQNVNKIFLKDKNIQPIKYVKPQVIKKFQDLIYHVSYKPEWIDLQKQKFIKSLDDSFQYQKQKIISDSLKDFDRTIKKQIQSMVSHAFYDKKIFCESFWEYINKQFKQIQYKAKNSIVGIYTKLQIRQKGNNPVNKVINEFVQKAHFNAQQQLKTIIQMKCNDLLYYMMRHFSVDFNMDEKQIPRQWADMKPEQITIIYEKYKEIYLKLIDKFNYFNYKLQNQDETKDKQKIKLLSRSSLGAGFNQSNSNQLLKSKQLMTLYKKLEQQMKNMYEEALKKNKQVYMGSIPTWGWIIFLLVAFDDILLWLHSPYLAIPLTIILILTGAIFFFGGKSTAGNLVNTARKGATNLLTNVTARATSQMLKRD